MLDSSPIALPPVPRPLKRSASVASLPTPPRTRHKRKSARSRNGSDTEEHGTGSDSDEHDLDLKDGLTSRKLTKKQRTNLKSAADDDEEAFWMGTSTGACVGSKAKSDTELDYLQKQTEEASSPPSSLKPAASPQAPPLLYRRGTAGSVLVSPPPSNRKVSVAARLPTTPKKRLPTVLESPHITPRPLRDSPDNPFLVTPSFDTENDTQSNSSNTEHLPRTPQKERPTITYVFRGVRGTFPNPLYDHKKNRPRSPSAKSRLPVEHPDFSPSSHITPKLLFPEARAGLRRRKNKEKKDKNDKKKPSVATTLEQERARNIRNYKNGRRDRELVKSGSTGRSDDEAVAASSSGRGQVGTPKVNIRAEEESKTEA